MPDRPTYRPVYKALHRPLTIWGVDRRLFFLALLLGAATFNLFYSFLAGLLMFGGLYGFALWATAPRPGDAPDPPRVVPAPRPLRPGQARPRRRGGAAMVSDRPHPPRLPRGRERERAARALGLRRRHDVPDEGRPRRRRLPAPRHRLRGADPRRNAGRSSIASRPPFACSTSTVASTSTSSSGRSTHSLARPCSQPVAHEAIQRRAAYLNARVGTCTTSTLYLVLLYEPPRPATHQHELRRRSGDSPARRSAPGSRHDGHV